MAVLDSVDENWSNHESIRTFYCDHAMTPDEIPQELLDILDAHAGKTHSRQGPVVIALAAILTRYQQLAISRDQEFRTN